MPQLAVKTFLLTHLRFKISLPVLWRSFRTLKWHIIFLPKLCLLSKPFFLSVRTWKPNNFRIRGSSNLQAVFASTKSSSRLILCSASYTFSLNSSRRFLVKIFPMTCYSSKRTRRQDLLDRKSSRQWFDRGGSITGLLPFTDFAPRDFCFWGYIKMPTTLAELSGWILAAAAALTSHRYRCVGELE